MVKRRTQKREINKKRKKGKIGEKSKRFEKRKRERKKKREKVIMEYTCMFVIMLRRIMLEVRDPVRKYPCQVEIL